MCLAFLGTTFMFNTSLHEGGGIMLHSRRTGFFATTLGRDPGMGLSSCCSLQRGDTMELHACEGRESMPQSCRAAIIISRRGMLLRILDRGVRWQL
jgi:hypothetical protein